MIVDFRGLEKYGLEQKCLCLLISFTLFVFVGFNRLNLVSVLLYFIGMSNVVHQLMLTFNSMCAVLSTCAIYII